MLKLAVPVVILFAVVAGTMMVDRPRPPADFTFINGSGVTTLDLHTMSWMQDLRAARVLWEGLVRTDVFSWDYKPQPGVAEAWDLSADGLTYTFHLRADARWSNGEPVMAEHFRSAWRRGMLPESMSDYVKFFMPIRGAREFFEWRAAELKTFRARRDLAGGARQAAADALWQETLRGFDALVAVRAPDTRTLVVELDHPVPYFIDLCAFPTLYPLYPPSLRPFERVNPQTGHYETQPGWTKPANLVTNGPFRLAVWRFKRDMRLERNEHYWNRASVAIDSISMPYVDDPNAQVLSFRTGGVDWVTDVTPPYRREIIQKKFDFYREHADEYEGLKARGLDPVEIDRRLPADPRNRVHVFPAFGTYFYNFNCLPKLPDGRDNPFADPRVRRAFAMAIDKRVIAREVRGAGEPVANVLIPPDSIGGYTSPKGLPYDPPAARQLLADAGYPGGTGFITVTILYNQDSGHDLIAQAVARNWQENLGVSVSLVQREVKIVRTDLKSANYMTSRAGWFGDYGDPTTFLNINRTGDGNNDRKYSNAEFDGLLAAADLEPDPSRRLELLRQAETILVERDLPLVPLFHYRQVYLFDPHKFTGISSHPRQEQIASMVDIFADGKGTDRPKCLPPRPPADAADPAKDGRP